MTANASDRSGPNRLKVALVVIAALGGIAGVVWYQTRLVLPPGVSQEQYRAAEEHYRLRYGRPAGPADVFSLLGEQCVVSGRFQQAARCFAQIPSSHPQYGRSARLQQAQVLMRLNRAIDAEQAFREFLALEEAQKQPRLDHLQKAYQWLVYLLSVELRLEDRKEVLAAMHQRQLAEVWESKLYYFPHQLIWNSMDGHERLLKYLEQHPDNRDLKLAHGRYLVAAGEPDEATSVLTELHEQDPEDAAVIGALLDVFYERADWSEFARFADMLKPYAPGEPWLLTRMRGEFALHQERWSDAVTHFQHVLEVDPANPWSQMGLAKACGMLGDDEQRRKLLDRSRILADIRVNMYNVSEDNARACRDLADKCDSLQMPEAAESFRRHAQRIDRRKDAGSSRQDGVDEVRG